MSLQLWLPFNGDAINKGLLNTSNSTSGIVFADESKIGKKSLKSSVKVSYDVSAGNISTHKMSLSFWGKADSYTGTSTAWWQVCSLNCNDGTSFHVYCVPNVRYKIEYKPELNTYCDTQLWHHITYILEGTVLKVYLDGVLNATANVTNDNRIVNSITIGTDKVCVNDFKVYNHILSVTEIERDYNTLLIHYPLRDKYIIDATEIVYDCSGRGYHSDARGNLTIAADTARNSIATHFTPNNGIKIPSPYGSEATITEFTLAFWLKLDTTNSYMYIFGTNYANPTGSSAGWFSVNCESSQSWFYSDSNYWKVSGSTFPTGQWHHVALTFKDGTAQHYYDGQPLGNAITNTRNYIKSGSHLSLGDTYTSTSWSGTPFTGDISDFRFYASALSASCIKDLYLNSGTVDSSNNIHVYELVEE